MHLINFDLLTNTVTGILNLFEIIIDFKSTFQIFRDLNAYGKVVYQLVHNVGFGRLTVLSFVLEEMRELNQSFKREDPQSKGK